MSFGDFEDLDVDDDEGLGQTPEIEQPELEDVFASDISDFAGARQRVGAERISPPFLGKLAKARLIAARTSQLWAGAPSIIPPGRLRSSQLQEIAKQELQEAIAGQVIFPIKIVRKFPDGTVEIWAIPDFKYIVRD